MKKKLPVFLIIILVLIIGFLGWKFLIKKKPAEETGKTTAKPKIEAINQLALEKRPYIIIEPKSKTKPQDLGHWITITIDKADDYQTVEYDVEYQTGNLIQGFMHRIDFSKESLPVSKEGFFGSESKGKYKYDEEVKGGSTLFKFFKDSINYDALKTYFNLQNKAEQDGVFTSNDGKATLEVGPRDLSSGDYLVIASTLGLPAEVEARVISEPYGFYSHQPAGLKDAALTIKSKEDLTKAKILGWDGEEWQEYEVEIEEDSASTKISQLGTYVLVTE